MATAAILGFSAAAAVTLSLYYGTLSAITILAFFILVNVVFSLQTIGTTYSNSQALSGVFVMYIYGGAIVMLFLLAAVSIPRNQLTSTTRPSVNNIAVNRVLALASWPCTLVFLIPALQVGVLADRRTGFLALVDEVVFLGAVRLPLGSTNTNELLSVAQGMVQEPLLYVQACALLMLGLVVVLELTTNTQEVSYFSKHANQNGVENEYSVN